MSTAATVLASGGIAETSSGIRSACIRAVCRKPSHQGLRLHGSGATRVNGGISFCIGQHLWNVIRHAVRMPPRWLLQTISPASAVARV
jgi:hypothetical protein